MASKKAVPQPMAAEVSAGVMIPSEEHKPVPFPTPVETNTLSQTPATTPLPQVNEKEKEMPKAYNEANSVALGGEIREIKSTKLKYHRNKTAVAYKIFQVYPLPDAVSFEAGIFDPERDGDQILFDFLVAVFDDADYVQRHYDDLNADDLERILEIFCRVNHITEKEEQAKNRLAKETRT